MQVVWTLPAILALNLPTGWSLALYHMGVHIANTDTE